MKLILILACLALYVAQTQAQCPGAVRIAESICINTRNDGDTRNFSCFRNANNNMWFYDRGSGVCRRMSYRGCGGNNNRYCTQGDCSRRCGVPFRK
ncbi:GH15465 [Drosophila grimshawi]|uniref:GH15465 n=1 Tax=Drosophila grimshawi TaxID=7222 RepID=B4J2C4_DROGR|nr:GH15465 [Drosophila grimshawi]